MATFQLIEVDNRLATFCTSNDFRVYVKQAINDELFLRDLFSKLNLSEMLESKLNAKVPRYVKDEVENILPRIFETKMLQYMVSQFPANVSKEINNQLPVYLNNNYQMQQILETHKSSLKILLEKTVNEIMERIVSDPRYNEVVSLHLAAIDRKGEETLREIVNKAANVIQQNQSKYQEQFDMIRSKIDNKLITLETELSKVADLKKKLGDIDDKYERKVSNLQWCVGFLVAVPMVYGLVLLAK